MNKKDIFGQGGVAVINAHRAVLCHIGGFDKTLYLLKSEAQESPNVQITTAMNGATYLLNFGDKLSSLSLAGIVPLPEKNCGSTTKAALGKLFKKYKLGSKKLMSISIGPDTYKAQVVRKSVSVSSEQPELLNFSLALVGFSK